MKWIHLILAIVLVFAPHAVSAKQTDLYGSWVKEMKESPRGPFLRIRWFCNDGSILEPKEYACVDHGGGVQHGEWTDKTKTIRSNGYFIANIFADIQSDVFIKNPDYRNILKQMILEQFLIQADDGWIFRKARYYRGALQVEGESQGGEALLKALLEHPDMGANDFLLMREAARLLPHFHKNAPTSQMRQLALTISETDKNFEYLRIKTHVKPEANDAHLVRQYAQKKGLPELEPAYNRLADLIDDVFQAGDITRHLFTLADQVADSVFAEHLRKTATTLSVQTDPPTRFNISAKLTLELRDQFYKTSQPEERLALIDTGILIEDELFRLGAKLLDISGKASVGKSLEWLKQCTDVLYGTGLISSRQHKALKLKFSTKRIQDIDLSTLHSNLMYASRASDWTERSLQFHFSMAVKKLESIEPIAGRYVHDRLHSSLMLIYSQVLDRLIGDSSRLLGISHSIWGKKQTNGINGLNPGLTRGILQYPDPGTDLETFPANSILVLPATTSDLPPVAGIITAGRGNILSHVQLLARNLGIPNVAVADRLLPEMKLYNGKEVVLAVSPKGMVKIEEYHAEWETMLTRKKKQKRRVLMADTDKLDLNTKTFITLKDLRAKDSGRIAGPKAANLGELKYHFPEAVTNGVVIPFGMFKYFLEQPFSVSGPSMFEWMKNRYTVIQALREKPDEQNAVINDTLKRIREWILKTDPGKKFKTDLKQMLENTLGPDESYGVFVRSDTNVEDLPGFTGAGLNLTVPHVVGFENIFQAIKRVWASPFTERSFGWRHTFLENPEHVYASVLLMKTVPVEKSGVMVTKNLQTGESGWLTIAVNEGVGGAVSGQTAEELSVFMENASVTLLAQATEPLKRVVLRKGGMAKIDASGSNEVLSLKNIEKLIVFARHLPGKFPALKDDQGREVPADVEFGFLNDQLVLFQIRPFLDDYKSQNNQYLNEMDTPLKRVKMIRVNLDRIPEQEKI